MKIGTRVRVVDDDYNHSIHFRMFSVMGFKKPDKTKNISIFKGYEDIEFVIFSKKYDDMIDKKLYGIIDNQGNQFLFEKEGLEKIKKTKKIKEETIEEVKDKPFPKVMKGKDSDLKVYFTKECKGIVIVPDLVHKIYTFSDSWIMQYFEDTDEQIIVTFK